MTAEVGHGDGQRKKNMTAEDGSTYSTTHVGVVLSLKPILKSWPLCLLLTETPLLFFSVCTVKLGIHTILTLHQEVVFPPLQ